jgi:uncharacterized membrane protein
MAIPALAAVARYGAGDAQVARALLGLAEEFAAAAPHAAASLRSLAGAIRELALSEAKLAADRALVAGATNKDAETRSAPLRLLAYPLCSSLIPPRLCRSAGE